MPSTEDELGGLNSDQRRDLRDCASRLKKLLLSGAAVVDLRGFLPPPEAPHRRAVLHELIKTELEARYARGQGCLLEEFLRQYPELGRSEDLPAGLLYEEYRLRRLFGDCPNLDEYRTRFPLQFEQFRQRVHLDSPPESPPEVRPPITPHTIGATLTCPDTPSPKMEANAAPLPPPPAKPSGSTLSQLPGSEYQLLQRIGKGCYGEVYRALAPGGVVVAVKRIFRSMDDESSQRELKALDKIRELRHPFLLQTHRFQAFEDRLLIVMELADGSLEDRLKECQARGLPGIPAEELLRYFTEAAEALDFLHQQKLTHRDIKPQNLLHLKGHAKVADFGIARPQENLVDHTMRIGGTPAYMPPEMFKGDISVHSDQYSFAMTWYEMRTGQRVFHAKNEWEIAHQHLTEKPALSGVPQAEQKVLLRALAKKSDQRFPTCVAFVQALREAMATAKWQIPVPGRGVKAALWSLAITLALAIALAAFLLRPYVVLWMQPQSPPPPLQKTEVDWNLKDQKPEDPKDIIADRKDRRYYRRLVGIVGPQRVRVVMVAVPQTTSVDPPTFYIMENKVWNELYETVMQGEKAKKLLKIYSSCRGCETLLRDEWRNGGYAENEASFGVKGKGKLPVFRVTVTEAHCFAECLGGRLPTQAQWLKAAGLRDDTERKGPFDGDPAVKTGLAIDLKKGPWEVENGVRDVSIYGCRQMASNGYEWTRELADNLPEKEIPLRSMVAPRHVFVEGQSYLSHEPLTFEAMNRGATSTYDCTVAPYDVSFRVVLEER